MLKSFILIIWVGLIIPCLLPAQEQYVFKKALAASIPVNYGREAIYTDPLAYELYTQTLKTPVSGMVWGKNQQGEVISWQQVEADSANRLFLRGGGRGFGRGGYMYLTYEADKAGPALLNIRGNSGLFFNGVPHAGDPYRSGWLDIPVMLKKGLNELYVRGTFIEASITFPQAPVLLSTTDLTLPGIVIQFDNRELSGAVVVLNTTNRKLKGLTIKSVLKGNEKLTLIPDIPPMSSRKVPFSFDGSAVTEPGNVPCRISLLDGSKVLDETDISIEAVSRTDKYSITFTSTIDGSLQYYAVAPQKGGSDSSSAMFLSVHGAGVEAIGQARAYASKDWGNLVAPTNRRPRGFNWEDWGRLDALEVLELARNRFNPDPKKIYLTGHSMGGHGTWFLGATYPDKWAAIAPCAGYPTLKGYGSADGLVPDSSTNPLEQLLLRSGNQSDVIRLATNYKPLGVYVFHGDDDRTVSVNYARQMRAILGTFHTDMSYYEYPGGSHWFGNESVDWQPIFDYFRWHFRKSDSAVEHIDFTTASPGISSSYSWAAIHQQERPLDFSRIQLTRSLSDLTVTGQTSNVRLLKLNMTGFSVGNPVTIQLDSAAVIQYTVRASSDSIFLLRQDGRWKLSEHPGLREKGPHRYGTLKEAFNHRMVFVYGTSGNKEENEWAVNKARYDAETWYYRGNGSVDILSDKEYLASPVQDRGIIIYGNKSTNAAWSNLLNDCPIQAERNSIIVGSHKMTGDNLGASFVWPDRRSSFALIGVITGSGLPGMKAANANQYFAGASGFPDFMIYRSEMLKDGVEQLQGVGFFDHAWQLIAGNYIIKE